jgi:hypothetical protein
VWQGARIEAQRAVIVALQEREGNGARALWSQRFDRRALRKPNARATR